MNRYSRLHTAMFVLAIVLACLVAGLRAQPTSDPAVIRVETDGLTSRTEVYGGDLGYPGPNSVEFIRDELGTVIIVRQRVFPDYDEWTYLPMVESR